jgi:hypothetical protein
MAIIYNGRVVIEGEPSQAIESLNGRIWRKMVTKAELPAMEDEHAVISTRLVAGRTVVHVLSEEQPVGFEPVQTTLEDVYFSTLRTAKTGQQAVAA